MKTIRILLLFALHLSTYAAVAPPSTASPTTAATEAPTKTPTKPKRQVPNNDHDPFNYNHQPLDYWHPYRHHDPIYYNHGRPFQVDPYFAPQPRYPYALPRQPPNIYNPHPSQSPPPILPTQSLPPKVDLSANPIIVLGDGDVPPPGAPLPLPPSVGDRGVIQKIPRGDERDINGNAVDRPVPPPPGGYFNGPRQSPYPGWAPPPVFYGTAPHYGLRQNYHPNFGYRPEIPVQEPSGPEPFFVPPQLFRPVINQPATVLPNGTIIRSGRRNVTGVFNQVVPTAPVSLGSGSLGVVSLGNGQFALGSGSLGYVGNQEPGGPAELPLPPVILGRPVLQQPIQPLPGQSPLSQQGPVVFGPNPPPLNRQRLFGPVQLAGAATAPGAPGRTGYLSTNLYPVNNHNLGGAIQQLGAEPSNYDVPLLIR